MTRPSRYALAIVTALDPTFPHEKQPEARKIERALIVDRYLRRMKKAKCAK